MVAEATPRYALHKEGHLVAVVSEAAYPYLPFSTAELVATPAAPGAAAAPYDWRAQVKVTAALEPKAALHWLLVGDADAAAEADVTLSWNCVGDLPGLVARVAALPQWSRGGCFRLLAMSEADANTMVIHNEALRGATRCKAAPPSAASEAVLFGDGGADVAAALGELLERLLQPHQRPLSVLWPAELPFPVNVPAADSAARRVAHAALGLPRRPLLHLDLKREVAACERLRPPTAAAGAAAATGPSAPFRTGAAWEAHLVTRPHTAVEKDPLEAMGPGAELWLTTGDYDYYHYHVDGFRDDGWGCAYRSLQTILSWFQHHGYTSEPIPSVRRIQEILFTVDADKMTKKHFVGSKEWIGSFEIMLVLQHYMPGLECVIKRMESGTELDKDPLVQTMLLDHFSKPEAPPVMIGGSSYAHTILGVCMHQGTMEAQFLILDPHYVATTTNMNTAAKKGYVGWKQASKFFEAGSWYNMCIPQVGSYDPR